MTRRGNQGPLGCCHKSSRLWGVSANMPNPIPTELGAAPENDPSGNAPPGNWIIQDPDSQNTLLSRGFAFNARDFTNEFGNPATKEVLPEIWPGGAENLPTEFHAFAAMLPASWPASQCDKYPPISTAVDGGDGSWEADLGPILTVEEYQLNGDADADPPIVRVGNPRGLGFVLRSRACYVDGVQEKIVYSTQTRAPVGNTAPQPEIPPNADGSPVEGAFILGTPPAPTDYVVGDTHVIPINSPADVQRFNTGTCDGFINVLTVDASLANTMEGHFKYLTRGGVSGTYHNTLDGDGVNFQPPCFAIYLGRKYAGFSSYNAVDADLSENYGWQVARILYEGHRIDVDHVTQPGIEVFSTVRLTGSSDGGQGRDDTTYTNDYIVMLFSQRCYVDSSVVTDENFDEPYVVTIHKDFSTTKILCAQWTSSVFKTGVGSETNYDGVADGAITSGEFAAGEMIMDASAPPDDYPDETFLNPRVWCYNRVWDPVENKNVNLLLITTENPEDPTTAEDVIADFETDLNHGLPAGIAFTTSGGDIVDNYWIADSATTFSDDPIYTADGGSWVARNNMRVNFAGEASLSITVTLTEAGDVTLPILYDNRGLADRHSTDYTSGIANIPNTDNTLSVVVDGAIATTDNFKIDGTPASGLIDHADDAGSDTPFITYRMGTLSLTAGTHTIRLTTTRGPVGGYDRCLAQVGYMAFPTLMLGDDINGLVRWAYDGYTLRKLSGKWAWAARDEEVVDGSTTPIASRATTVPHFITMDGLGRTLIGNTNYVFRLLRDGTLDETHGGTRGAGFENEKGWRRFTASPNIDQPPPSCLDPDDRFSIDQIADAPPGSFMILPVPGTDGDYQVRGANGSFDRDTTRNPIHHELFTYKHPVTGTINGEIFVNAATVSGSTWADRVHSWTISDDGRTAEPHVEVIFRPTMHQPAWPGEPGTTEAEYFPHPPYRSTFADSGVNEEWAPVSVRWRDPRRIDPGGITINTGTVVSVASSTDFVIGSGGSEDHGYDGCYVDIDNQIVPVSSYNGGTRDLSVGLAVTGLAPGDTYRIFKLPPRWSMSNFIIPRTYSDAWSRLPQPAWVRNTSDGPSNPLHHDYWDPDDSETDIAARKLADDTYLGKGGPFGSAMWVMVQSRFNPTGFRYMTYVFNASTAAMCTGHGPDDTDESPVTITADIQRPNTPHGALTDFDVAPGCDCGCK